MPRTEFATLKEFHDYVRRMRKLYAWEGTRKYADRQRRLSPDQYEIVDVCYSRGIRRAMLYKPAVRRSQRFS